MSRLFGDIPEDTTQGKKSLSEVLPSQPKLASICRNVPEDGQPYRSPSPRAYEVLSDNLNELSLVESDRELFASIVVVFPTLWSSYRLYLPGHLTKRSSFRHQLVVLLVLRSLIMQACHDLPASGGHSAFKATFDGVRDRYWWPTMQRDIQSYCNSCDACQRRKTPHRRPLLPTGNIPVDRPFQRVAIDLVEYKTVSQGCKYVLSVINHLIRFVIFDAIPNKEATTIARTLVDRVFFRIRSTRVVTFRHG